MKKRFYDFKNLNFSDCREITGDELYKINGGERVENSNEAVAQAQVGDTIERDDGSVVTLNQGDINWAKEHVSGGNTTPQTTPDIDTTNPTTLTDNPIGNLSITTNQSSTSTNSSYTNPITNLPTTESFSKVEAFYDLQNSFSTQKYILFNKINNNKNILNVQYNTSDGVDFNGDRLITNENEKITIINSLGTDIKSFKLISDDAKSYFKDVKKWNFVGESGNYGDERFSADTPEKEVKFNFENSEINCSIKEREFSFYSSKPGLNYEQISRGYEYHFSIGSYSLNYYDINKDGWIDFIEERK